MPLLNTVQSNLTAGQLSPLLEGQVDFNKYYNGARKIKNIVPLPSGGGTRRPGFKDIELTGDNGRLIKFQASLENGFALLVQNADNGIVRAYKDGVHVGGFSTTLFGTNDIDLGYGVAQSKDTLFLVFKGGEKVIKLITADGASWTVSQMTFIDGPYEEINADIELQLDPVAAEGTTIINAKKKTGGGPVYFFQTSDVGRLIRIRHNFTNDGDSANNWGYATILGMNGAPDGSGKYSAVDVEIAADYKFGTANATINWRLGKFTTAGGFADSITFFANRFWFGKGNNLEGSVINSFDRFSPTVTDDKSNHTQTGDSAVSLKLLDLQSEYINWIVGNEVLHIGTDSGRHVLRGADAYAAITPTGVKVSKQSAEGCANIQPIVFNEVIYVRADRRALLATSYDFRQDTYEDVNLNELSDTILNGRVKKIVKMTRPFKMIWVLLDDGKLLSLTYNPRQEVIAWAEHEHGSGGEIIDIEAIESGGDSDKLYILINKGGTGRIQILGEFAYRGDLAPSEHVLLDGSTKITSASPITGYTARHDLDGEEPYVIQNFYNYPQEVTQVGANYTFAEPFPAGTIEVGFPIDIRIEFFPFDVASANSSLQTQFKHIQELLPNFFQTLSATVAQNGSNFPEPIKFRDLDDDVDVAPPLFSGRKPVGIMGDSDQEISVIIYQEEQAPFTLLSLGYKMAVEATG